MMSKALKMLLVGLGNSSLTETRHSIGMVVLNGLASRLELHWAYNSRCGGQVASSVKHGRHLFLLKPKYLMNINGKSVAKAAKTLGIHTDNIYLVHDDLDRPLGKISFKLEGSAGGHNGVKSVISSMKTDKIRRFRFGIGRPTNRYTVTDYVLSEFSEQEQELAEESVEKCIDIIFEVLRSATKDYSEQKSAKT